MKRIAVVSMSLLFCACGAGRWENPHLPAAQWDADREACARDAFARGAQRFPNPYSVIERSRPGPEGEWVRRREQTLSQRRFAYEQDQIDACMRAKGYVRTGD